MTDLNQAPAWPDLTPEGYLDLLNHARGLTSRLSHAESGISHAQTAVAEANARASHADAVAAETSARAAQADAQRLQAEALTAQAQAHSAATAQAAQAQAQAQAQASAAAHNSGHSSVKPKRPEEFKGKDSGVPITLWIIVVEQYLRVSGFPLAVWAEHVATMFAGPALIWWAKRKIDGIADHDTWDTLKAALLTDFSRPNAVRNLRDRLAACRQNGSALSYANEFRSILVELPAGEIAPREAFDRFYRGLKPNLRVEINKARITSLDEAISYADSVESSYSQGNRVRSTSYRSHAAGGATPMELGAMRTEPRLAPRTAAQAPRLSAMQRAQHDVQGRCYKCHRTGHTWRNCPKGTAGQTSGNGSAR